ncbi:MAG: hypothetical protein ACRYFU_24485, partial [Janthinobacterium lividum]
MFQTSFVQKSLGFSALIVAMLGGTAHAQSLVDEGTSSSSSSSVLVGPVLPAEPGQQGGPALLAQGPQAYPYVVQEKGSYWHQHSFDLAGSAVGRFQQTVTTQQPSTTNPTEGVGALANVRLHPVSWAGLELNYSYNRFTNRYAPASTGTPVTRLQQSEHEATAGYVLHIKSPYVQPFVVLGGGGVNFRPTGANPQYANQWRG